MGGENTSSVVRKGLGKKKNTNKTSIYVSVLGLPESFWSILRHTRSSPSWSAECGWWDQASRQSYRMAIRSTS